MLMAGATAVGVGSAVYYRGPAAITAIRDELAAWLNAHGVPQVQDLSGRAHHEPLYSTAPTGAPAPAAH
jgi:dihydroorotate dehydrogenase (NAD+) catalytic subunit